MKSITFFRYVMLVVGFAVLAACGGENIEPDPMPEPDPDNGKNESPVSGISNIDNAYADKTVSFRGATVSVKFDASASWTAELELKNADDGDDWAYIAGSSGSGAAKKGSTVRVAFDENETSEERVVDLWVTVEGFEAELVATLKQAAAGTSADAAINTALNTYMHDILKKDYLFNEAYNAQDIDLSVNFSDFLSRHLLSLGDVNVADGGYYRASLENAGERFIYTNLVEIVQTKAMETGGLGFGPFLSSSLPDNPSVIGIAPSYVRRGSPAAAAGLRRGDIIYEINGMTLTSANYYNYMISLYTAPVGSYTFGFLRFEQNGHGGYDLNAYKSAVATVQNHVYDPVLHASILTDPDNEDVKIGYLVYESFDLNSQEFLKATVEEFAAEGITDLILDLRFNAGGAVAQSRWLSGCIAGEANGEKTFVKVVYNDGDIENWKFNYGYNNDTDNLGKPVDLGLDRLYVICSYNTASAAELVINSLKGIDFPVKLIGCRTEGKNVGMTVSETTYNGRRFQFSPVTFWVKNAKDFGDYPDGMAPDEYVNNDNGNYGDDADNVFPYSFSDWGNMDYNIALQWAYCDITGKPRWKNAPETKSGGSIIPVDFQQLEPQNGHSGNLIHE